MRITELESLFLEGGHEMKMAYIATEPKTNRCYAICSADPDFIVDATEELAQWKKDGAIIELLPKDEALKRFSDDLPADTQ